MYLIGDSHVRSYTNSKFIEKIIFIGKGSTNNFINIFNIFRLTIKLIILKFNYVINENNSLILICGEPDVRFAVYNSFVKKKIVNNFKKQKVIINKSISNFIFFSKLIFILGINFKIVIGSGSPDPKLNKAILYFNSKLKNFLKKKNIIFFDPQYYYLNNNKKSNFISKSIFNKKQIDNIHFSKYISTCLDKFFLKFNKIKFNKAIKNKNTKFIKIKNVFLKYDKKFNCYKVYFLNYEF